MLDILSALPNPGALRHIGIYVMGYPFPHSYRPELGKREATQLLDAQMNWRRMERTLNRRVFSNLSKVSVEFTDYTRDQSLCQLLVAKKLHDLADSGLLEFGDSSHRHC